MKKISLLILLVLLIGIVGCGKETEVVEEGELYQIYYLNREETKIVTEEYYTTTTNTQLLITELLKKLAENPEAINVLSTIRNFEVVDYSFSEQQLQVTVSDNYSNLSNTTEILVRAAIVKTMTQIEEVSYVSMKVGEKQLMDTLGNVIGVMTSSTFIDNSSKEVESYDSVTFTLYFANEEGTALQTETRAVSYNSNFSMEKLVIEEIIKGPQKTGNYPVISSDTSVVSVTSKDGICYVNLNSSFPESVSNVTGEVALYAIVNSLIELPHINKVQFYIDGEENLTFRDGIQLTTVFERNLNLVVTN